MKPSPLPPLPFGQRVVATAGIALVTAMTILDLTIANVALPTIAGNLGVAPSQGTWVITFYGIANAIAIPLTGWIARRLGEVRIFLWATGLFVLSSFLCGISPSLSFLITARILQGLAAGPLIPLSQSLLVSVYPPDKRGLAMAMWSMTVVLGPILGPILGGYICDNYSWHWIFFVNVPVGILCLMALRPVFQDRETPLLASPIDKVGLALLVVGVGSLQLMLDEGKDKDWFASPYITILGIISLISLTLLVIWELAEEHPVVDLSLFKNRNYTVATICICLGFMIYFSSVVLLPMTLQTRLGYTAFWAGLTLAPIGFFSIIISPAIGRFAAKLDMRLVAFISFLIFAACFFWRSRSAPNMDFAFVAWPQFIQGAAVATFFLPLTNLAMSNIEQANLASASSLFNCLRTIAGSVGASITITLWDNREALHHTQFAENLDGVNLAFQAAKSNLAQLGLSPEQSVAYINQEVTRQGYLLGFNELFWVWGVCFLLLSGLVWLAAKPGASGSGAPGGH